MLHTARDSENEYYSLQPLHDIKDGMKRVPTVFYSNN